MKEINEHLESTPPRWDADLGRWIEPEEFLDTGDESPNQSNETGDASGWHKTYQRGLKQHIAFTNSTIKTQ